MMNFDEACEKLNTIYIISKGRPECHTAATLVRMKYPGKWFIVCGNNDESVPEYIEKWGADRVLIFDWYEQIKTTNTMDNFGFEHRASGACPVRNATKDISQKRGELRHWQFDDDYNMFTIYNHRLHKNKKASGKQFQRAILEIAMYGYNAGFANIGFGLATQEGVPDNAFGVSHRVFNAHNMRSDDEFVPWIGRLNDDTVNAFEVWRHKKYEAQFHFIQIAMPPTQSEQGGLTALYQDMGTVSKTGYAILEDPHTGLVIKFGRYHHKIPWKYIAPKMISEVYRHGASENSAGL